MVTGGAGKLGGRFAQTLAARGAKVAILDLHADGIETTATTAAYRCDVTDRESVEAALAAVEKDFGPPYGLVNAAAIDAPPDAPPEENGPLETYPLSSWHQVMEANCTGTFLPCQVVGARLAELGRGSIVLISSIYGVVSPNQQLYAYRRAAGNEFYKPVAYSVSKSALFNLTRYLATYWAPRNVRVNTATFGGVLDGQDPEFLKAYGDHSPIGRMARPGEYDGVIVFLMSDSASYMTGANMVVDGGWTAW